MRTRPLAASIGALLSMAASARAQVAAPGVRTADEVQRTRARAVAEPADEAGRAAAAQWLADLAAGAVLEGGSSTRGSTEGADGEDRAARTVGAIAALHCAGPPATAPAFCSALPRVACDLERLAAERLVDNADRGGDPSGYARAAERYLALAERPACPRRDELLYNAAKAFQAARDLSSAVRAFERLASDLRSPLAPLAIAHVAGLHRAVGDYEPAARALERSVDVAPKEARAPADLADAVVLRSALGDLAAARKDVERFEKLYGATRRAETAALVVALFETLTERAAATAAPGSLDALAEHQVDVAARASSADLALRAHANAARYYRAVHRDDRAKLHAGVAVSLAPALRRMNVDDDPTRLRALARALTSLGEAHSTLASIARDGRPRPAAPVAAARLDDARLADFVAQRVSPWLTTRLEDAHATERDLTPIVAIEPMPPPKWVVAAAGEVAVAYVAIDDEIERIAVGLDASGRKATARAVRQAAAGARTKARSAALAYRTFSVKYQATSDHASRVDAWLTHRFPREHPALDEIVPRPRASWPGLVVPSR